MSCRVAPEYWADEDGKSPPKRRNAGHGGEQRAVFVYQIESYRYWQEQLERTDFVHGQFGENFTVEGLPDDAVCIGDRYQIGSALFEVTQPRYMLSRRHSDERAPDAGIADIQRATGGSTSASCRKARWAPATRL
jgi:MOSC domain-containing protein YiiM